MGKAILIISTDATRTGTPVLLLNTLKWLRNNSDFKFILILQEGGELLDEFKTICDVYTWPTIFSFARFIPSNTILLRIAKRILLFGRTLMFYLFILNLKRKYSIKLIFSNTARNGEFIALLQRNFKAGIILYVHEGDRILDIYNSTGLVSQSIAASKLILTVSESVKNTLLTKYQAKQKVVVIPGGVNTNFEYDKKDVKALLRDEGIADDKIVLMSCGWMDWHKGTDIFIQLAIYLSKKNDRFHFVWLGGEEKDEGYKKMKFDITKLNLSDNVTLLTSRSDAQSYISCANIFLMLSREESFSLVTLEAGLAKKPVICFEKSGGPLEILNNDQRFIVPYIDVFEMGNRIIDIINDKGQYNDMSNYIYNRVIENYTIEKCASSILKIINQELAGDAI